jgi:gamma-glutamyltranspeptidase / glutathione hydrolase
MTRSGELLPPGATMQVPGLAESLAELAREGPDAFYRGRLGREIADCIDAGGGLMGRADRLAYRAVECRPVTCELDGWTIAVPPPPAIGGATLAAMLARMGTEPRAGVDAGGGRRARPRTARRAGVPAGLAGTRRIGNEFLAALLSWARAGGDPGGQRSASTVHISAMDQDGLGCAITASSGYGSGVLVPGAGIWLNNCLGELELNPRGFHRLAPAERMASNMSPAAARRPDGAALALGSPGAERITTALLQVMLNFMRLGLPLEDALAAPRLHVERVPDGVAGSRRARTAARVGRAAVPAVRPAVDVFRRRRRGAAACRTATLVAAADPRRQGRRRGRLRRLPGPRARISTRPQAPAGPARTRAAPLRRRRLGSAGPGSRATWPPTR